MIRQEEAESECRFGEEYLVYKRAVAEALLWSTKPVSGARRHICGKPMARMTKE